MRKHFLNSFIQVFLMMMNYGLRPRVDYLTSGSIRVCQRLMSSGNHYYANTFMFIDMGLWGLCNPILFLILLKLVSMFEVCWVRVKAGLLNVATRKTFCNFHFLIDKVWSKLYILNFPTSYKVEKLEVRFCINRSNFKLLHLNCPTS